MLGLVNGEPMVLSLKQVMQHYLHHRQEVITRRTRYDLNLANQKKHILEGLKIAIDNLDAVIALIRNSRDRDTARRQLVERFNLTEEQANAILDMRMAQLTGLERDKIEQEYQEILLKIADYEDILARPERVKQFIKDDLDEIKQKYGDKRRTQLAYDINNYEEEDFIEDQEAVITLTHRGYIKRQPLDVYKSQKRGGRGISSTSTRSEDFISEVIVTGALSNVLFFTNQGRVYSCKAHQLPESSRQSKGMPLINFLELGSDEKVTTMLPARYFDSNRHLLMVTKQGIIKKVMLSAFENIRKNGLIAINLDEGDELVGVLRVEPEDNIMVATSGGISIVFKEDQVREMGRTARGVKAISLLKGDWVVGVDKCRKDADVILVTENGYGKRTALTEFKTQNRGGRGLKTIEVTKKNGKLVAFKIVSKEEELVILTGEGQIIRLEVDGVPIQKRYSRGVLLMRLPDDDKIVAVARFKSEKEE